MLRLTLVAILWPLFGVPGYAQETPATGADTAPVTTEPAAPPLLSAADITNRADAVTASLLEIQKAVDAEPADIVTIPGEVDALSKNLDELLESQQPDGDIVLRQSAIETLTQTLNRMTRDLDGWHAKLNKRADELDKYNGACKLNADYFASVLTGPNSDDLPDVLTGRIKVVIGSLDKARKSIRAQLDGILATLAEISTVQLRITQAAQAMRASQQQRERSIPSFDSPPIWKMKSPDEPLGELVYRELQSRLNSAKEFWKTNEVSVIVAFILLVVILGLAIYARPAIIRLSDDTAIDTARRPFIERPIALGLLLWGIVVPQVILPQMPLALVVLRLLVVVAALWRTLTVIAPKAEQKFLAGLLALTAVSGVLDLLQLSDASNRIALIFVSAMGAYVFRKFRHAVKDSNPSEQGLWWNLNYLLTIVAPPILIACILAVILGVIAFAEQTIDGVFYLFTLLLAIIVVEDSLNTASRFFIKGPGQSWLRSIRRYPDLALRRFAQFIRLLMLAIFLSAILRIFPFLSVVPEALYAALTFEISIGTVQMSARNILAIIAGLILAVLIAKYIRFTLDEDVFPRLPVATGSAAAASRLIYYALVVGGILFALAAGGVELNKLTLIISALGVGIGFGLQGIVNNFVSGLVLAFERPFQVGDIIAAGTLTGRVREIGLRASRVRTFDGAEVIVPNADLIAGNVINWTLSDRTRRLDIRIGVAYGTDPRRVKEILLKVAEDSEVVTKDPEPAALFEGFGDSSLNFNLRVWIPEAGDWPTLSSDLYVAVHDALVEADIEIPFPQRTLHIRKEDI